LLSIYFTLSSLPQVPSGEAETQALIRDTRAVTVLEVEYAASLDFGGISTDTVRAACRQCTVACGHSCRDGIDSQSAVPAPDWRSASCQFG